MSRWRGCSLLDQALERRCASCGSSPSGAASTASKSSIGSIRRAPRRRIASMILWRAIALTQGASRWPAVPGVPLEMDRQQSFLHNILDIRVADPRPRERPARHRADRTADILEQAAIGGFVAGDRRPHHAAPSGSFRACSSVTAFIRLSFRCDRCYRSAGNIRIERDCARPCNTAAPTNEDGGEDPSRSRFPRGGPVCRKIRLSPPRAAELEPVERRRRPQARTFRRDPRRAARHRLLRGPRRKLHGRRRPAASPAGGDPRPLSAVPARRRALDRLARARSTRTISRASPRSTGATSRRLFSEHLAWSSHDQGFLDDLLPLPYTEETLATVCAHIDETQETLGRRMLLENPSTYVLFEESTIAETDFLGEIVAPHRLRPAARRQQRRRQRDQPRLRPRAPISPHFPRRGMSAKSISPATPRIATTPACRC